MKNYKKLITGSLMAAIIVASPIAAFAKEKENDDNNGRQNERKEEQANKGNWFSSWFGNKSSKNVTAIPNISNVVVNSNKSNKATISWNSDVRSNSMIWYSKTSGVDTTKAPYMKRNDRVFKHKFEIKKLQANTTYYVVVGGATSGGIGKSSEISFTTGASNSNISIPVITSISGPATVKVNDEASFTIKAYDPQNKALSYEINWGDDKTTTKTSFVDTATVSHIYDKAGTFVIKFMVTNSDGKKATYPMQIKVMAIVTPDTTSPIVKSFVIPATSTTLNVNITSFTATDAVGVTGYKLTETGTAPLATDAGWTSVKPTTYTFASAGAKTLYAWAKDASGNVSASLNDSVIITLADTVAPVISSIATNVTGSNAVVSWTTNESATTTVFYTTTTPVDVNNVSTPKVSDSSLATNHSISIPGLASNTLYHFIVKSVDASNNVALSSEAAFTTN